MWYRTVQVKGLRRDWEDRNADHQLAGASCLPNLEYAAVVAGMPRNRWTWSTIALIWLSTIILVCQ